VKDNAKGVALPGANAADAMTQIDPISAFRTSYRPVVNGEQDGVALSQRHHLNAALHSRPLFGQYKFAASEIPVRFRQ
jgi:hypothetical protein